MERDSYSDRDPYANFIGWVVWPVLVTCAAILFAALMKLAIRYLLTGSP